VFKKKSVEERLLEQKMKEVEREEYLKALHEEGEKVARERGRKKAIEELKRKQKGGSTLGTIASVVDRLGSGYMENLSSDYDRFVTSKKTKTKKNSKRSSPLAWLYG
jgi:tRNA(Ile2) C34 agmatinyltransferase TiaS